MSDQPVMYSIIVLFVLAEKNRARRMDLDRLGAEFRNTTLQYKFLGRPFRPTEFGKLPIPSPYHFTKPCLRLTDNSWMSQDSFSEKNN